MALYNMNVAKGEYIAEYTKDKPKRSFTRRKFASKEYSGITYRKAGVENPIKSKDIRIIDPLGLSLAKEYPDNRPIRVVIGSATEITFRLLKKYL